MFITKRKVNNKYYFSLEERYRENGKVKSRSFSLGNSRKALNKIFELMMARKIDIKHYEKFKAYIEEVYVEEDPFTFAFEEINNMINRVDKIGAVSQYKVLGVKEDATVDEIKKRYRKLMKILHPDVGGDEHLFKMIDTAYKTIMQSRK